MIAYLDLLFADGAGGLDGIGALVAELGHGLSGHQLYVYSKMLEHINRKFHLILEFTKNLSSGCY
jgi:hypothetical protein